jgi:hypothetical protein
VVALTSASYNIHIFTFNDRRSSIKAAMVASIMATRLSNSPGGEGDGKIT